MKFILNEYKKFILEERYILTEGAALDKNNHANIIKFYPGSELKGSGFWKEIGSPDVSEFNKYLKKTLNDYFGAEWITKKQCDELIQVAAENKNDQGPVHKKFAEFKKEAEEKAARLKALEERLNKTSELIKPLKNSILEYYKKLLDKKETLKTEADEFSNLVINFLPSISSITDLNITQTRTKTFVSQLQQNNFFKTIKDEAFINAFNKVNELTNVDVSKEEIKTSLKTNLTTAVEELKKTTEIVRDAVIKTFVNSDLVDTLKTATENTINLLTSYEKLVVENKSQIISNESFVENFEVAIKDIANFINADNQNKSFEELINETIKKFNTFTGDTKNNLNTILNSSNKEEDNIDITKYSPAENETTTISQDWDREYRSAVNKEAFWEIYIKKAWGEHSEKIKAISKAIKLECTEYGFKQELNPFISYINNYYLNSDYNMLPQAYFAVHDAVAENVIDAKELVETSNKLGGQDIIFCKNIAKKSSQDVLDYIKLQKNVKDTVENLNVDDPKLNRLKQILGNNVVERKELKKIQLAIMYDIGDLSSSNTKIENYNIDTKNARLRTHQEIQLLIKELGGTVSTNKDNNQMTDAKIKTLVNTFAKVEEATKATAAIIVLYAEDAEKTLDRYEAIKNAANSLTVTDMLKAKKTLNALKATKIDSTKLVQIIDAVAEKFDLKKAS